ncbi:MAG: hypothetical protein M3Y06_10255 [Actinomycetota bacterium]|nr:hypothetical protein [Actinomycetota bacterium]
MHLQHGFGHHIALHAYRLPPDRIIDQLRGTGFGDVVRVLRDPGEKEKTQAFVLATKDQAAAVNAGK